MKDDLDELNVTHRKWFEMGARHALMDAFVDDDTKIAPNLAKTMKAFDQTQAETTARLRKILEVK